MHPEGEGGHRSQLSPQCLPCSEGSMVVPLEPKIKPAKGKKIYSRCSTCGLGCMLIRNTHMVLSSFTDV